MLKNLSCNLLGYAMVVLLPPDTALQVLHQIRYVKFYEWQEIISLE